MSSLKQPSVPADLASVVAPAVRVIDLTIGWDDVVLLQNASFEIDPGDIFMILGGSGCGKSTLLRYIVGLETPKQGSIEIDGAPLRPLGVGRPPYGMMFQSGALLGSMTVGDNIALPLQQWTELPPEAIYAIVQAKLRLVGLQGTEDKMPSELSGGMKKRAAIARAMALEPKLMFLDEPSAGLDPITSAELDELLLALNRSLGLTLVIVTHELESIFAIGQHCIVLDKASKSIIARGNPNELKRDSHDPRVSGFFNRTAQAIGGRDTHTGRDSIQPGQSFFPSEHPK